MVPHSSAPHTLYVNLSIGFSPNTLSMLLAISWSKDGKRIPNIKNTKIPLYPLYQYIHHQVHRIIPTTSEHMLLHIVPISHPSLSACLYKPLQCNHRIGPQCLLKPGAKLKLGFLGRLTQNQIFFDDLLERGQDNTKR